MVDKILVCMPTYHSPPEWVHRAVDSVKAQTYQHFECWIVKDGCAQAAAWKTHYVERACLECDKCKETNELCEEIVSKDSRFKFSSLPINFSGAGWGPRNYIIMNTHHDLIAYLDDDNWYDPDHLEELYKVIKNNNADMSYTGTRLYNIDMQVVHERLHNAAPAQGYIDTSEMMHRRHIIYKHGGWRYVNKGCDWDLVKRWNDVKWSHTNKITLNFYLRENCGVHRI